MKKTRYLSKVLAVILAIMICFGTNVYASNTVVTDEENNSIVSPCFIAITRYWNNLTLNSGGRLTCEADLSVNMGYIASIDMELQQYSGGWTTIKSWTGTNPKNVYLCKDWYVAKNYSYRLKLTYKALDSSYNVIETFVTYSNTVTYN